MAEQPALASPESISGKNRVPLNELALFFLRLGTTAFGGPAAQIAIMEDELVRRRQWLSREKFLDMSLAHEGIKPQRTSDNSRRGSLGFGG
jgi:chromate transporter